MAESIRIAACSEIPAGAGREFVVEGKVVAIFQIEGEFYAMDGLCPHAGGPIGTGTVRGCIVTCPWHGWQLNVTTGEHCLTKSIRATTYPLEQRGDDLWITLK